jgi:hypothetical protein
MPITRQIRDLEREITVHLYRAVGEKNRPDDLQAALRNLGLKPRLLRKNPVTDDVWIIVLDLVRNHGQHAITGTALIGLLTLWLKERIGRRIEIERSDIKVKAPTVRDIKKALAALHDYDELSFSLNNAKPTRTTKKKAVPKERRTKAK